MLLLLYSVSAVDSFINDSSHTACMIHQIILCMKNHEQHLDIVGVKFSLRIFPAVVVSSG